MATAMREDLRLCSSFELKIADGCLSTTLSLSAIVKDARMVFRKLMALVKSLKMAGLPTSVRAALVAIRTFIAAVIGVVM